MAAHDPMDLDVRSQEFYRDFYHFHKNFCDAWYIKDATHRYVDASISFSSLFLPPNVTSVANLTDECLTTAPTQTRQAMQQLEKSVFVEKKVITFFMCRYFNYESTQSAYVCTLRPYRSGLNDMVICHMKSFADLHFKSDAINSLVEPELDKSIVLDMVPRYADVFPPATLTKTEWLVAWLVINGKASRWIAEYLSIRRQNVNVIMRNVYLKLKINDKNHLRAIANYYSWADFIPSKYFNEPRITCLEEYCVY